MKFRFETAGDLASGIKEFCEFFGLKEADGGMTVKAEEGGKDLTVCSDGQTAVIKYPKKSAFFYGLSFLPANYKKKFFIKRDYKVKNIGIIRDVSEGAVLNGEGVKTLILCAAALGYDYIGIYLEDLITVKEYPYLGNLRGAYTREQIKNTVDFADMFGMETVPFVQTLAHLSGAFRRDAFYDINDIDDVLLVGNEKTYEFTDALIKTVSENFSSRRINIGMDGSPLMFMGKYLDEHGFAKDKTEVFMKHVERIVKICDKYGLNPEMWSDVFLSGRMAGEKNKNAGLLQSDIDSAKSDKLKAFIAEKMTLTFREFNHTEREFYEQKFDEHFKITKNVNFAGSAWTDNGFAPAHTLAEKTLGPAAEVCRARDIQDAAVALMGEGGGECSVFSALSTLVWFSEKIRGGNAGPDVLDPRCRSLFNSTYRQLKATEEADRTAPYSTEEYAKKGKAVNPSKYLLYNDPLVGVMDAHAYEELGRYFDRNAKTLRAAAAAGGKFSYIADYLSSLCEILITKADLGNRIRKAYRENDRKYLYEVAENILPDIKKKIKVFYIKYKNGWDKENKSVGFEIMQVRLGGLMQRTESCAAVIKEYLSGETDCIETLEDIKLPVFSGSEQGEDVLKKEYTEIATGSLL